MRVTRAGARHARRGASRASPSAARPRARALVERAERVARHLTWSSCSPSRRSPASGGRPLGRDRGAGGRLPVRARARRADRADARQRRAARARRAAHARARARGARARHRRGVRQDRHADARPAARDAASSPLGGAGRGGLPGAGGARSRASSRHPLARAFAGAAAACRSRRRATVRGEGIEARDRRPPRAHRHRGVLPGAVRRAAAGAGASGLRRRAGLPRRRGGWLAAFELADALRPEAAERRRLPEARRPGGAPGERRRAARSSTTLARALGIEHCTGAMTPAGQVSPTSSACSARGAWWRWSATG